MKKKTGLFITFRLQKREKKNMLLTNKKDLNHHMSLIYLSFLVIWYNKHDHMINDTFIIDYQVVLADLILNVVSIRAGGEEHGHNGPRPHHHPHNIDDDDDDKEDYDNCEEHSSATSASDRQHSHEAAEADVLGRGEAAMQGRAFLRHEGQELPAVRRKA